MKLSESLQGFKDLPPQKKRVLAIGGIAFIILLFVSFLISLTEDDNSAVQDPNVMQGQIVDDSTNGSLTLPSSQRYDFEQNNSNSTSTGGLESLLHDAPDTTPVTNEPIGENNNPFANMQGSGTVANETEEVAPSAPVEIAPPAAKKSVLYCDSFNNAQAAESQKAILAFQGIVATVVKGDDGNYRLKLGPFTTSDEARSVFNDLGNKSLINSCHLMQE